MTIEQGTGPTEPGTKVEPAAGDRAKKLNWLLELLDEYKEIIAIIAAIGVAVSFFTSKSEFVDAINELQCNMHMQVTELSADTLDVTLRYETDKLDRQIDVLDAKEDIGALSASEKTAREKYREGRAQISKQLEESKQRLKHAREQRLLPKCGDLLK
jgi:hypothetical protein